jgi:hypothetical protein
LQRPLPCKDLSGGFRWSLEIRILCSLSTRLWFVQNWNTQVACETSCMLFVFTEWNACRSGLFGMPCVFWVERTCMICHHMKAGAPFCILTPLRSIACVMFIDVLSRRVNSPNLLSVLDLITHRVRYDSLMRSLVFLISV